MAAKSLEDDDDTYAVPNLRPRPSRWRYLGYLLLGLVVTLVSLFFTVSFRLTLPGGAERTPPELFLVLLAGVVLMTYGLGGLVVTLVAALLAALVRRKTRD